MIFSLSGNWLRAIMVGFISAIALPGLALAVVHDQPQRHDAQVIGAVPQVVMSGAVARLADLPSDKHLHLVLNLPLRNQAQLQTLIQQLYDPGSPNYRQYLSVAQFTERFAATQADYDAVVAWARAQGFHITSTVPNRRLVAVDAAVGDIDRALNVHMGQYRDANAKHTFYAPDREPSTNLPIQLLQITGLNDFSRPTPRLRQGSVLEIAHAMAAANGSGPGGEYLPSDMRAAYYGSGPLDGAGQTVAIFSFDGYLASDVGVYFTNTGMTSNVPINNVLVDGYNGDCVDTSTGGPPCDDGEQILDIVNVIGMAPGISQILFYEGTSGPAILNRIATDNLAQVISCSWGSGDLGGATADTYFREFQAQGQTYANATGDSGAYDANAWAPPSLDPYILQVGGTDLTTSVGGGPWSAETAWEDSGGGYYSAAGYNIPTWQQTTGVINATNKGSTTLRNDPDVSAEANFDNPTVSNGQFLTGYGGTSFAAPRWAGFIALANEQAIANGGTTLGFANPAIYNVGTGSNYASDFHDIVNGTNQHTGNAGFNAVAKYDLVTGWGSPNGTRLISALSGSTANPGFVLSASPVLLKVSPGNSIGTTLYVHALNGFSGSVTLAASGLPSGVTALFSPNPTTANSTLTLTVASGATLGNARITVSGASTSATQNTLVSLLVGGEPSANVTPSLSFDAVVTAGDREDLLSVGDATNSLPLSFTAAAYASNNGACSGSVAWLALDTTSGSVDGGQSVNLTVTATPASGSLTPGNYTAEVCLTTNDPSQPNIVVPVGLNVVSGPSLDTIFRSGFETGEVDGSGLVVFNYGAGVPVEADQDGSALNMLTGVYHTWSGSVVDDINLYDDSANGFSVYWYDDKLSVPFKTEVGCVLDANSDCAVLQAGALIGSASTFGNSTVPLTQWKAGVDGYFGVAFHNAQTGALNYGFIHVQTTAPTAFPAQVLDYGFDNSGAAVRIP